MTDEYIDLCVFTLAGLPLYVLYFKAQPHAAMLHTCDGVFPSSCDGGKLPAILCDVNSNMFVILLPILEYLSHLSSDFQTVCSILMVIP